MKVLLFGATGMVGQGVLRECLLDETIQSVLSVGRNATGQHHQKLQELKHDDFMNLANIKDTLTGYDACFFCLGVSSVGMSEEEYRKISYDLTLSVAHTLVKLNPTMTFIYVSGTGTDSSEKGRVMWARVKGKTENDLLKLPFKAAYMFRPAVILPLHGVKSKTKLYQFFYNLMGPIYPILKKFDSITTTEQVGRAMIKVAKSGYQKAHLENTDINSI
ncbi:NAD-dependent epimerase/dehydratase family protein [Neobacillus sp. CF12]|uniref:NAD-dependent epimerase/dehydratase family protein n=1 Tax=Neobacillus sp. CF12 TaxID=3055864 RepID=UPI0025A0F3D3|nr:NAD-dependent epimerase/dehydratase family protein [Neobacillus sp. CF12]MDM5326712.1 NAD-dependent epimerase/dehydratase family protein [Neobacillus sp. CF12]